MEHDEKPLPIDIRLLGALAEKVLVFFSFNFYSFLSLFIGWCSFKELLYCYIGLFL